MIVITGATGLLGSHLIERFSAAGIPIAGLCRPGKESLLPPGVTTRTGDVLDQPSLREAFEGAEAVIHSAAFVSFNPRRKSQIYEVNAEGTRNVVNTCLQLGIPRLIHISSVAALGRKRNEIITETSAWTEADSAYGHSKYLAELEVFRGMEEGLEVSLVNPSVILSASRPGQSSSALLDYVWQQKNFYVDGVLNYVDARDVAEVVFQLYEKPAPGEKFILSAGSISLHEFFRQTAVLMGKRAPGIKVSPWFIRLAGLLEEVKALILGKEPQVTRESARLVTNRHSYDNTKVQKTLNFKFRELQETLEWCCNEYRRHVKTNNR